MHTFHVTVRTPDRAFRYAAIAACSADLVVAAFDSFADARSVVVTPRVAP